MRQIGDRRGERAALGNLGGAFADLGVTRRTGAVLGKALIIFDSIESLQFANVRGVIARLNNERGT